MSSNTGGAKLCPAHVAGMALTMLLRDSQHLLFSTSNIPTYTFVFTSLLILKLFVVFPIFGAASASTAALPLLFIPTVTDIKDGVEGYRRAQVDEVNTSAVTKLAQWRNVSIASDPRPWY